MIWLFLALIALSIGLLLFSKGHGTAAVDPLAHYKAQLAEIAEDKARGILDDEQARAATLEVERRILRVANGKTGASLTAGDVRAIIPLAVIVLAGAGALYALMGRPDLPAKPGFVVTGREALVEEGGPTFGEAIKAVQAHLEENPRDAQGWQVLAQTARAVRDYSTAANAFAELAELQPDVPTWRLQQFEAMMAMANGQIVPASKLVLARFIDDMPEHPAGQYFLGLAKLQAGDEAGAKAVWQALADRSGENAPWMPALNAQLAKLGVTPPKLSDDQVAAVGAMSAEERQAFIQNMMARLAARLEAQPDDPEGWMMLARSHLGLGEREAAIAALERGIAQVSEGGKAQLQALLDNLRKDPDL